MFYSVDILTRKGRLGLIWLAATYGESKKGMANRDFRKVNIPRACHDIVNPVVPFALRLSSHLMIGVVRIYHEQTKTVWGKEQSFPLLFKDFSFSFQKKNDTLPLGTSNMLSLRGTFKGYFLRGTFKGYCTPCVAPSMGSPCVAPLKGTPLRGTFHG
ncbi:uncharacterized protein LOC144639731, partial [Oculina patagonica]